MIVSYNYPDAIVPRLNAAFQTKFNYAMTQLPGETPLQFFKRMNIQWQRSIVAEVEAMAAADTAAATARTSVDTDIVIT